MDKMRLFFYPTVCLRILCRLHLCKPLQKMAISTTTHLQQLKKSS